jgi:hypothetical protein
VQVVSACVRTNTADGTGESGTVLAAVDADTRAEAVEVATPVLIAFAAREFGLTELVGTTVEHVDVPLVVA